MKHISNNDLIILSIKPTFAKKIFNNQKTVELRKIRPKNIRNGSIVLLYVSSPDQSLQGAFIVDKIIEAPINDLWNSVSLEAGISKEEYENYFFNTDSGFGIYIDSIHRFETPIELKEIQSTWSDFIPPQGFRYASAQDLAIPQLLTFLSEIGNQT